MAGSPTPSTQIRPNVWLDARRALWLSDPRLLVVADLHWGYVASHRARGNLLPHWGDDEIALRLRALLDDYAPLEMVWLGDSVHSLSGTEAAERFIDRAGILTSVVAGNHDRRWKRAALPHLRRGDYFLHHGHQELDVPPGHLEIIGHHHPAVSWYDGAGGRLKLPALVDAPRRIILPAFSPWAAGTPWNARATSSEDLWVVSSRRVFRMPKALERPA